MKIKILKRRDLRVSEEVAGKPCRSPDLVVENRVVVETKSMLSIQVIKPSFFLTSVC